jgi:hypothetical protein
MVNTTNVSPHLAAAVLVALTVTGGAAGGEAGPPPPGKVAPRDLDLCKLFKKLKLKAPAADAEVLPRHAVDRRRRLRYEGLTREKVVARTRGALLDISVLLYEVRRVDLVRPAGDGLARCWFYSESKLIAAKQAGRDYLRLFRERPSGGMRLAATARRLSGRGLEPSGGDLDLERRLGPVPEFPLLPGRKISAARPYARMAGRYLVTWKLAGTGELEGRKCWALVREVELKGEAGARSPPVTARAEYLLDAADFTVLGLFSRWTTMRPGSTTAGERAHQLRLVERKEPAEKDLAEQSERVEKLGELLRAVARRDAGRAERTLEKCVAAKCPPVGLRLAERFVAAEKAMAEAKGGARRLDLVPEDTFALVRAPAKIPEGVKLTPVLFFHGAAARAEFYFKDWCRRAGARPLLLVFPQSRDWTWNARSDGAVVGSLLEVLGRTYDLDRKRLVLAGHGTGGEMAMLLGYGADFPGYRVRGVVSAGALMSAGLRRRAYDQKPPALLARLRATDSFILGGMADKKVRPEKARNLAAWLRTYNPRGVRLELTPKVALRYAVEWTPEILEWISKLPAEPRGAKPAPGKASRPGPPGALEKR